MALERDGLFAPVAFAVAAGLCIGAQGFARRRRSSQSRRVLDELRGRLASASGMDIFVPFSLSRYNEALREAKRADLTIRPSFAPATGSPDGRWFSVLVGNDKRMWNFTLDHYKAKAVEAARAASSADGAPPAKMVGKVVPDNPVDDFVEAEILEALAAVGVGEITERGETRTLAAGGSGGLRCHVFWVMDVEPGRLISAQKLAELVNLAWVNKDAAIAVHPEYGAWFALRAVLVFDTQLPLELEEDLRPPAPARDDSAATDARVKKAAAAAFADPSDRERWISLREAVEPGHASRYGEDQLKYHYYKDVQIVRDAVQRLLEGK